MPLVIQTATPTLFVLADPDSAARLAFAGTGLTYGPDGFPISGTLDSLRLDGFAADLGTGASHVEVIRLGGLDVATLAGFDWFASADPAGDPLDPTPLLALAPGAVQVGTDPLNGGTGDDRLFLTDSDADIGHAYGHDGDDWIRSNRTESELYGGDGNDTLIAAAEFNNLYGGAGNDLIRNTFSFWYYQEAYGGAGNDTLIGSDSLDSLVGDAGDDLIRSGASYDNVTEWGLGGDGNDTLRGGAGCQEFYGGNDDDRLFGGEDSDVLMGGDGNDTLRGGDGWDGLIAQGGRDILFGGADTDTFVFSAETYLPYLDPDAGGTGLAIVADFTTTEDRFWLDTPDNLTAEQSFGIFLAHARQAGDNVIYDDPSGYRVVVRDLLLGDLTVAHFIDDPY